MAVFHFLLSQDSFLPHNAGGRWKRGTVERLFPVTRGPRDQKTHSDVVSHCVILQASLLIDCLLHNLLTYGAIEWDDTVLQLTFKSGAISSLFLRDCLPAHALPSLIHDLGLYFYLAIPYLPSDLTRWHSLRIDTTL